MLQLINMQSCPWLFEIKQTMHPTTSTALLFVLAMTLQPLAALAEKPTPSASREIEYLIAHLKSSDCQFMRNGTWYEPGKAAAHLRQKYDYLLKKDLVASAEEFIARAGSESSMSSKPYQVRCGSNAVQASSTWLTSELAAYRKTATGTR